MFYSKNKLEKSVQLVGFYDKNLSQCMVIWMSNAMYSEMEQVPT